MSSARAERVELIAMARLKRFFRRLSNVVRPGRLEPDLARELASHLRLLEDEYRRRGMAPEDARLAARHAFGGVEQTKDLHRDARSFVWMDDARRDLLYAARLLRRNPVFALTAALSLAIGIGATVTIFTVGNGLLFNAAPGVAQPDRLVDIVRSQKALFGVFPGSYPEYLDVRQRATTLDGVYVYQLELEPMSLGGAGVSSGAERVFGNFVTANYFAVLGVPPSVGRLFSEQDSEQPGASAFAVLSHRFWTRRFNADPAILGQTVLLNGHPLTVVGVAREGFRGTSVVAPDLWLPATMIETVRPGKVSLMSRRSPWLMMGARLKPGVLVRQASAEMDTLGRALEREHPDENRDVELRLAGASPIPANLRVVIAGFLALLLGLVSLVLVIACANLAGILLARATARRREIAVRLAIGAGRMRLVRQLLTETLLVFVLGGSAGLLLARAMTSLLLLALPAFPVPVAISLPLDGRVIVFATGLSLIAALLSGLAPALHASKADVVSALKDESQGPSDRLRLRSAFVVAQVAFSILLVVAGGLLVRALDRAGSIDRGFDPRGVEVASLDLALAGYTDATGPVFVRDLVARVRELPGVQSATAVAGALPTGGRTRRELRPGRGGPPPHAPHSFDVDWNVVEPEYFATLRIPLVAGRDFSAADRAGTQPVAIVSATAARRFWPGKASQEAVGQPLPREAGGPWGTPNAMRTLLVIGVARDVKSPGRDDARSLVYAPFQQQYESNVTILARASRGQRIAAEIRALVASMNPNLPIIVSQTLEDQIMSGPVVTQLRVAATVSSSVGIVGLLLATIGIYGVTSYAVMRRTREIGIRIALGAQRADVVGMILRQGMSLVAIGAAIGLTLAAAASRLLTRLLFGIPPIDPLTFAGAAVLFAAIGLAACYVPARRAIHINAMEALRYE
jgi:predicted permease